MGIIWGGNCPILAECGQTHMDYTWEYTSWQAHVGRMWAYMGIVYGKYLGKPTWAECGQTHMVTYGKSYEFVV